MSLTKVSTKEVVKKQFFYKLKSCSGVFSTLIVIQMLAVFFSFNGSGSMGAGMSGVNLSVTYYSSDIVIIFTMLWAFITAFLITTKSYRYEDFTFVTNRMSSHLSNGLFLAAISLLGTFTALLSGYLLNVLMHIFFNENVAQIDTILSSPQEVLIGFAASYFYLVLLSSLGYFTGMLMQLYKAFLVVMPVVVFGVLFISGGNQPLVATVFQFYYAESSFLVFALKAITTIVILYASTIVMTDKMEVSR